MQYRVQLTVPMLLSVAVEASSPLEAALKAQDCEDLAGAACEMEYSGDPISFVLVDEEDDPEYERTTRWSWNLVDGSYLKEESPAHGPAAG